MRLDSRALIIDRGDFVVSIRKDLEDHIVVTLGIYEGELDPVVKDDFCLAVVFEACIGEAYAGFQGPLVFRTHSLFEVNQSFVFHGLATKMVEEYTKTKKLSRPSTYIKQLKKFLSAGDRPFNVETSAISQQFNELEEDQDETQE